MYPICYLLVFCMLFHSFKAYWHAYDPIRIEKYFHQECKSKDFHYNWINSTQENYCPCFESQTRPLEPSKISHMKLWSGLMDHVDLEKGETLYGTDAILDIIWKNQNPEDCSKAKYIISGGWPYGFGSRIHMEGKILALAINLGRVYLPHPDGDNLFWVTDNTFCKDIVKNQTLNCYYEMSSKCTINDALLGIEGDVNSFPTITMADIQPTFVSEETRLKTISAFESFKGINVVMTYGRPYDINKFIPYSVKPIFHCAPINYPVWHYYWDAMSAGYILRPNIYTKLMLRKLSNDLILYNYNDCINMFVRHGDKGIEMALHEFQEYQQVAEQLWTFGLVPGSSKYSKFQVSNHEYLEDSQSHVRYTWTEALHWLEQSHYQLPINGTLFITTEDQKVLEEADLWGENNHWKISYTNLFNRSEMTAAKTWKEQHKHGAIDVHDENEYLSMILNLQYSLQCKAWVCTLASNSCRLIDELRSTIAAKANRYFADLSNETCSQLPCVLNPGMFNSSSFHRRLFYEKNF